MPCPDDDVRVLLDARGQQAHDLVGRVEGHVRSAGHVDQRAAGSGHVHVQQRVVEGFVHDFLGALVRFAVEHHRDATVGHDGPHVGEIEVDERGQGDGLDDALDDLCNQLVHDREGLLDGQVRHVVQQAVVVEDQHRVRDAAQRFEALERPCLAVVALDVEGRGHDADHQRASGLGFLGHDRRDAGPRAAAQAAGDEHQVRAADDALDHLATGLRTAASNRGVTPGPKAAGDVAPDQQFLEGAGVVEVLLVGVDGHRDGAVDAKVRDAVQGVVARAATADDEDARIWDVEAREVFVHERRPRLTHRRVPHLGDDVRKGRFVRHAHACTVHVFGSHPNT